MFSFAKYIAPVTFMMFLSSYIFINLLVTSTIELRDYVLSELSIITKKNKITLVLRENVNEQDLKIIEDELKSMELIDSYNYISSRQAYDNFFETNNGFSKEILPENTFPSIVELSLVEEKFDYSHILLLKESLKSIPSIDEIKYNEEFIRTFSFYLKVFKEYFSVIMIIIVAFSFWMMLITTTYLIGQFNNNGISNNGEGKISFLSFNGLFLILVCVSYLFFGIGIVLSKLLLVNQIEFMSIVNSKNFLINGFFISILFIIISIIMSLFRLKKK